MQSIIKLFKTIKDSIQRLSFRTGVIILVLCVVCYILSFAQMLLPISDSAKFWLWVALFGMAKLLQYTALLVLGMEGWRRLKRFFGKDKDTKE